MIQHDANGRFAEQDRLARFMEKICPEPMSGCWLWLAAINMHGYGTFRWNAVRRMTAHQAAFELFRGPRGGLEVLHHCDVRCCANPEHLYLGTQIENTLDAVSRGRWVRPPRPAAENIPRGDNHWTRRRGVTSFATTREHLHGQAGAAPNCAELHPVLSVRRVR